MLCYDGANEIGTKEQGSPIVCPYFIIHGRHIDDRRQTSNKTLQHSLTNALAGISYTTQVRVIGLKRAYDNLLRFTSQP